MNKIPVFISFDYEHDLMTKERLVKEWAQKDCPIWIKDCSLTEPVTPQRWQTEVAKRMENVKAVLVICGRNTHSANGVTTEVQMAQQRKLPVMCLQALQAGSSLPVGVPKDTAMVALDWQTVAKHLAPLANR